VTMPAFTRLIAVRHGETDWNAEARLQGQLDIALNARGRAQAQALARALDDEPIDALYASDLRRALATAQPLARAVGLEVRTLQTLRERAFGCFEGLTYAEIEERHPAETARWRRREPDFAVGGGETLLDFQSRCVAAVCGLAEVHAGQTIAVVAHGGVLDALYRSAMRIGLQAPRTWELGNASINRLLWTPQGLAVTGWNDRTHLLDLDTMTGLSG
jgi:2,3-bisphosphoglycerate-dependent phosphoglycerate mutase